MNELDILSYGISMTTLEEVFIKVNGELENKDNPNMVTTDDNNEFNMHGPIPTSSRGSLNKKKGHIEEEEEKALEGG